ncbi:hypothetical protein MHU86_18499 [Fragilaria crotonensis]|nr:hypothetical protein MHU86_18499 [Fragilaria crotonensis]
MDIILESNKFSASQIRRLNYCRLFLQAVTLSDISDETGLQLDPSKLQGSPSDRSSTTKWLQVHQDRPSDAEWKLWRKANQLWSTPDGVLIRPLGVWLHPRSQQRQQHFAYLHRRRLYIRIGTTTTYQACKPTSHPGEYRFITRVRQMATLKDSHPVLVSVSPLNPDNWQVHPIYHTIIASGREPASGTTFDEFVNTLDPWEIDVLRMTTMHVDPNALCEALSHGLRAASDGSVRFTTQGAFGWVLSTDQGLQAATGMGPARGPRPSSYRAEGYGLLSILRFLIRIAEFTGRVEAWRGVLFIKGHQDEKIPYAQLPLLARLNVDADAMAGRFQDLHGQDRPLALITPRTGVHLHLLEGTVTSSHAAHLRHAYCGPPLLEYLRIKNGWSSSTVHSINWQAHGSALRKQITHRIHFVKFVHDVLPTHSRQNRMDKGKRTCPCCLSLHEDRDHILRCPTVARTSWRHKFLTKLAETCDNHYTYGPLRDLLLEAFRQWLDPDNPPLVQLPLDRYPVALHPLLATQNSIDGDNCLMGDLASSGQTSRTTICFETDTTYQRRTLLGTSGKWQSLL